MGSLDIILNTIPVYHNYDVYTRLLAKKGKQVLLGLHKGLIAGFVLNSLTGGRSRVTFSGIGGIPNTQVA
jgi:alcohol dehydrogenase (NADP+)